MTGLETTEREGTDRIRGVSRSVLMGFLVPVLLAVTLFLLAIFSLILPRIEEEILNGKREAVRSLTTTTASLIREYALRAQDGEMSLEQAQHRAKERVRSMRYGHNNLDYFWINDMHPRMIMHPYRPDLEQQDITDFTDPEGKHLFVEVAQVAREHGEGFVEYLWQHYNDPKRIAPKISFVKAVPEWGWIVGTGVYLDDAYADIATFTRRVVYVCCTIAAAIASILAFVVWKGLTTERKRVAAEVVMRESESKYRTLVDMFPHGVGIIQDQKSVFANPALARMLGYGNAEELVGRDAYVNVADDDQERLRQYGLDRLSPKPSAPRHYEATFRKTDGAHFPVEVFVEPIDYRGRHSLQVIAIDITERKRSEAELRRLTAILESTSDLVSTALPDETVTYINQAGRNKLQWPDTVDVRSCKIQSLHPSWAYDIIRNQAIPMATRKSVWQGETAIVSAGGREIPVSQTVMAHRSPDGSIEYYSTIMRDITDIKNAQQALKESEARYRAIFEYSGEANLIMDGPMVTDCNLRAVELFRTSREAIIGATPQRFSPEFQPDGISSDMKAADLINRALIGEILLFEWEHLRDDGSSFTAEVTLSSFESMNKRLLLVTEHDVTARKQMENALRHSEATLQTIFRAAPIGIALISDRTITWANDGLCFLTGRTTKELKENSTRIFYASDGEFDRVGRVHYGELMQAGKAVIETQFQHKDGRILDILTSSSLIIPGDLSQGTVSTFVDLTEQHQAERERERLFNLSVDMLCLAGLDGYFKRINPAWTETLGWTAEELTSKPWINFVHPEDVEKTVEAGKDLLRGISVRDFQNRYRTKTGEYRWFSWNTFPVVEEQMAVAVTRDITEQKNAEEELERHRKHLEELVRERTRELQAAQDELLRRERMAALGQLTATVSHELRNPLGTIRGSIHLLAEALRGKETAFDRVLDRAERSILRCDHIIDELLSYTRSHHLSPELTHLDEWIEDALKDIPIPKDVSVTLDLASTTTIEFDRQRLLQCLINLVTNACEAMATQKSTPQEADHHLTIATGRLPGRLEIRVTDTGPGIPQEQLEKVFEPLFSTKSFGVGLGLAIVEQIMLEHRGGVGIVSTPGRGTTVTLWLPIPTDVTSENRAVKEAAT